MTIRLKAISSNASASNDDDESDSDEEVEFVETDADRRKALESSEQEPGSSQQFKEGPWRDFAKAFNFGSGKNDEKKLSIVELSDSDDEAGGCDMPVASSSKGETSTFTSSGARTNSVLGPSSSSKEISPTPVVGLGNLVQTEINYRKKEALGLNPAKRGQQAGRTLGSGSVSQPARHGPADSAQGRTDTELQFPVEPETNQWPCGVCTL